MTHVAACMTYANKSSAPAIETVLIRNAMPLAFLIMMLAFPVAEIASMIEAGRRIGLFPTLLLLFLGGIVGIALIRSQSFTMSGRMLSALRQGHSPAVPLAESGFLVIAGILFIIPGFVSDVIALVLMLPPVRRALARRMNGGMQVWSNTGPQQRQHPPGNEYRGETIIDVEFSEVNEDNAAERDEPREDRASAPEKESPWGK